jgi:LacI family transcriptional regulator
MNKTEQIIYSLSNEITSGKHGKGELPFKTVRTIASEYNVSLVTAQKVIKALKGENLLISSSTRGNYVNPELVSDTKSIKVASKSIGLILSKIANPFFSSLCQNIQLEAQKHGYNIVANSHEYDAEREKNIIEEHLKMGVAGFLITPGIDDSCLEIYNKLLADKVPTVFMGRTPGNISATIVAAHNNHGGEEVASHFNELGFKRCAYIAFGKGFKQDMRFKGYKNTMLELAGDEPQVAYGEGGDIVNGYNAMKELMNQQNKPEAVFAFNDLLAIGALRYCQEFEISVPEKVAIAGFDNLPESAVTSPALTTIAYPHRSMAKFAVQEITEQIEGREDSKETILLSPKLIVRQSTDKSKKNVLPSRENRANIMLNI